MDHGGLNTPEGHAAVGWLIVEDIITVLVLVLLPPLAATGGSGASLWQTMGIAMLKLAVLTAIVMLAGARFFPWLLLRVARLRSRELFTLAVLVMAICVATVSYVAFGASMALGAFLGGMVVGQSKVSDQAAAMMSCRCATCFAVLFFVAVGMLFDYRTLLDSPGLIVGVLAIILIVKPLAALVHCHRQWTFVEDRAHCCGRARADRRVFLHRRRDGEVARSHARQRQQHLVAAAIVSISLNPLIFRRMLALEPQLAKWPLLANGWLAAVRNSALARTKSPRNGSKIQARSSSATDRSVKRSLACSPSSGSTRSSSRPMSTPSSNSNSAATGAFSAMLRVRTFLRAAGLDSAAYLVVTVPHAEISLRIIQAAREVAPLVRILARAEYINQSDAFFQAGARHHPLRRSRIRRRPCRGFAPGHRCASGPNRCAGKRHPQRTRSGTERSNY